MKLSELATSLSSKNAGNFHLTLDVVFDSRDTYLRVLRSGAITPESVAALYGIPAGEVVSIVAFEPGSAIKVNLRRLRPSGDPGETDVFGAQQYAPLLDLEVP
jgi:Domain of unknown function (DUF4387)